MLKSISTDELYGAQVARSIGPRSKVGDQAYRG